MSSWMDRATRCGGGAPAGAGASRHAVRLERGAIAQALADLDLIPVLAFDEDGARRTADSVACNVAVLDASVATGPPSELVRDLNERVGQPVLPWLAGPRVCGYSYTNLFSVCHEKFGYYLFSRKHKREWAWKKSF